MAREERILCGRCGSVLDPAGVWGVVHTGDGDLGYVCAGGCAGRRRTA